MSINRSYLREKQYKKYRGTLKSEQCDFCIIKKGDVQFISEGLSFMLIRNIFPYTLWDEQKVVDHLLVVPKQHIESICTLNPNQITEYFKMISEYESKGYSIYARAPGATTKSIFHQHTHLIKTEGDPKRLVILLSKPRAIIAR